jgi:sugar fermentation stimulation protein A
MEFATPLVPATLIRRYKRFLADAVLDDGREIVAHCPNPGAMLGLAREGARIWLEPNDDPKKKLKYGWRLEELEADHIAGIDTAVPNRVVGEALRGGQVEGLSGAVRAEVPYGTNSRVDFVVGDTFVEVKNVHLRRTGTLAEFPDCVTKRGTKHLHELMEVVRGGQRAVMLYLVQRTDCDLLSMAADLDPAYASAFPQARAAGVEMRAYGTRISPEGVWFGDPIEVLATQRAA